jgi:hypothetical protein
LFLINNFEHLNVIKQRGNMKLLYKYLVLALVAVPLVGFTGGYVTNSVIKPNEAVAAQGKKGSSAKVYGRLWTQYSNEKTSGGNAQTAIMDDEGMARVGVKGKSSIGNGYAVNYKVEWAIDLGDGDASGLKESSSEKANAFTLKQGWLGLLTPMGQFKFGSMESPYKFMAKHDILHDTLAQMRDTNGISAGEMSHSGYWRGSVYYELKMGDLKFAAIKGVTDHDGDTFEHNGGDKGDYGYGIEYKNFLIKGFEVVYAYNHDQGADEANKKYTLTYNTKLGDKQKVKVWYMHEDVELDTSMFKTTGNGEVDWYGITYSTGPMTLMYTISDSEHDTIANAGGDAYSLGMQYKLSKTSRFYAGYSDYDGESAAGDADYRTYIFGLRHDF